MLDLNKAEGIIDLSLRPELLEGAATAAGAAAATATTPGGKKAKGGKKGGAAATPEKPAQPELKVCAHACIFRVHMWSEGSEHRQRSLHHQLASPLTPVPIAPSTLQVGDQVEATIQLIREGQYYVASLAQHHHALALLPAVEHPNLEPPSAVGGGEPAAAASLPPPHKLGAAVAAVVAALPGPRTGGQLLLAAVGGAGRGAKGAKAAKAPTEPGLVNVNVAAVGPLGLDVMIGQVGGAS